MTIKDATAIVGIGQTEWGKGLEDAELVLALRAIKAALDDAGIEPGAFSVRAFQIPLQSAGSALSPFGEPVPARTAGILFTTHIGRRSAPGSV